jgi:hypothetical protein
LLAATVLAGAMLVTFLTNVKQGTSLNVTVPVEAALVPLAACGVVWAVGGPAECSAPYGWVLPAVGGEHHCHERR